MQSTCGHCKACFFPVFSELCLLKSSICNFFKKQICTIKCISLLRFLEYFCLFAPHTHWSNKCMICSHSEKQKSRLLELIIQGKKKWQEKRGKEKDLLAEQPCGCTFWCNSVSLFAVRIDVAMKWHPMSHRRRNGSGALLVTPFEQCCTLQCKPLRVPSGTQPWLSQIRLARSLSCI